MHIKHEASWILLNIFAADNKYTDMILSLY